MVLFVSAVFRRTHIFLNINDQWRPFYFYYLSFFFFFIGALCPFVFFIGTGLLPGSSSLLLIAAPSQRWRWSYCTSFLLPSLFWHFFLKVSRWVQTNDWTNGLATSFTPHRPVPVPVHRHVIIIWTIDDVCLLMDSAPISHHLMKTKLTSLLQGFTLQCSNAGR